MSKTTNQFYSAAASVGKVYSVIAGLVMAVIIIILFVISNRDYKKSKTYGEKPISAVVSHDGDKCTIQYMFNSVNHTITSTCPDPFKETVDVYVNSDKPTDIIYRKPSSLRRSAKIIMITGIVLIAITSTLVYVNLKYKPVAALSGAEIGAMGIRDVLFG